MARSKELTELRVKNLKSQRDKQYEIFDSVPGFGVRVSPAGTKTFFVKYRPRGEKNQRRKTLGRYPITPLSDARRLAREIVDEARFGRDPHKSPLTFHDIIDRYLNSPSFAEKAPNTQREYRRILSADQPDYLTAIRNRVVAQTTTRDMRTFVNDDLREAAGANATSMANHVVVVFKAVMNWAVDTGLIDHSPMNGVKRPHKVNGRDRVLSDRELTAIIKAIDQEDAFRPVLTAILLTALRVNEVAGLTWNEVHDLDGDDPHLLIETGRMKNRRSHYVPLSSAMVDLLKGLPRTSELVFPGRTIGEKSVRYDDSTSHNKLSGWSKVKARLDKRVADQQVAIEPWTIHDFRHTAATVMGSKLGIHDDTIEEILAHVRPGIRGRYNHSVRRQERREALEKWADYLSEVRLHL